MPAPRLAVLLSGSGSTLQNLIEHCTDGRLQAELVGVVSSRAGVFGLERAVRANLPTAITTTDVFAAVRSWQADWVICAGWLKLLQVPADFRHRVLNVHPSLLPAFGGHGMYGKHVHEAVLDAGCKLTGCTVHFVDEQYDTGPIVCQRSIPVDDDDTALSLAEKVQALEREVYPDAIRRLLYHPWHIQGRRVLGVNSDNEPPSL